MRTSLQQLHRIGIFLFISSLWGCMTALENPLIISPQLVINGQLNNSEGQRQLQVLLVDKLDGKGERVEANASIYKDGQLSVELTPNMEGELVLPDGYTIEEEAEYFVEVSSQGKVFRSLPQVVSKKIETEDVSFVIEEDIQTSRFLGITTNRSSIEFFAHVQLPDPSVEKRYYRWVVDEAWNFIESNHRDTCFIQTSIYEYGSSLATNASGLLQNNEARVSVLNRRLDKSFAFTHFVNVYLHSLDKRTYEFYEKADQLANGTGTVYDEVPGPFRGNVRNIDDPEEVILGYVEFFLSDTLRFQVQRDDIKIAVPKQCDDTPRGGPCPYRNPPPGGGPPPPCQCLACEAILGFDAQKAPDYWID